MQTELNTPTGSMGAAAEAERKYMGLKLIMWLYIGATVMLFAAFTSAYIVRKAEGNWLQFELPAVLWLSSALLLASSGSLYLAGQAGQRNQIGRLQTALFITLLLGVAFVFSQLVAWQKLVAQGVYLVGNPAGGFVFIISGAHMLHVIGGMVALLVVTVQALRLRVNRDNLTGLKLLSTFWHAMDVLWVYLFVFLLVNNS